MPTEQGTHRVGNDQRRVTTPRRPGRRTSEVETAGNRHLWKADGLADAIKDVVVRRVELRLWSSFAVNPVEAKARLVDQGWAERMSFAERKERPGRMVGAAEARNRIAIAARLKETPGLKGEVTVEPVSLGQVVADVCCPAIQVNRRVPGADKP